jgi:hypothetical protein
MKSARMAMRAGDVGFVYGAIRKKGVDGGPSPAMTMNGWQAASHRRLDYLHKISCRMA